MAAFPQRGAALADLGGIGSDPCLPEDAHGTISDYAAQAAPHHRIPLLVGPRPPRDCR